MHTWSLAMNSAIWIVFVWTELGSSVSVNGQSSKSHSPLWGDASSCQERQLSCWAAETLKNSSNQEEVETYIEQFETWRKDFTRNKEVRTH